MHVSFSSGTRREYASGADTTAADGSFRITGLRTEVGELTVAYRLHPFFSDGSPRTRPFARKRVSDVRPGTPGLVIVVDASAVVPGRFDPPPAGEL